MRTWRGALGLSLLASVGALVVPRRSAAQGGEAALPIQPFALRDVGGWIEFEYEDEEERRAGRGTGGDVTVDRQDFSEIVHVDTRSYVYHPYLADIHFGIEGRATQGRNDVTPSNLAGTEGEDVFADTILADVTLFKRKPLVTYLFFHRTVEETDTRGIGSFEFESQEYGGSLSYQQGPLPASVGVSRRTIEGRGANREDLDERKASLNVDNRLPWLHSHLDVAYKDLEDEFRGATSESVDATFRQRLRAGAQDRFILDNSLRYLDQTGTLDREQIDVIEQVRYRLSEQAYVRARGSFQRVDFPANMLETRTGLGEIGHQLYESLTTTASFEVVEATSDFTETRTDAANLNFAYTKRIPGGVLSAGLHGGFWRADEESTGTTQLVTDEAHTFGAGSVFLKNPNVVISTVAITDPTGTITYVAGLDYLLLPRGTLTEVVRLAAGGIPPGGTVLVDYEFAVSSELGYDAERLGGNVRLALWEWFAVYGRYGVTDRTVTKGADPLQRIRDEEGWLVGASADYHGVRLTGEYEFFDSGLTKFDRQHARLNYSDAIYRDWYAIGNAAWTLTSFEGFPDEDVTVLDFAVGLRGPLYWDIQAEFDAWLRTEDGRKTSPNTDVRGLRAFLEWQKEALSARLTITHAVEEDTAGQEQERDSIKLSVRRTF